MNKRRREIIIIFTVIIVDQLIKLVMINKKIVVIQNFLEFTYTENTGIAFGLVNNSLLLIIISNIFMLCFIFKLMEEMEKQKNRYMVLSLSFIFSGGISNLIDRVFRGYVIDYINVNMFNFPNFNIADICITIGIIVLIFNILKSEENEKSLRYKL